eukprot:CAMPEP_0171419010 /NCGR_PEP_ID=MMETSP0880-20121228/41396_1 /TAXON_ID=67004 /ORGANISM="Thalassiosira weissflogii, Strain CCMP1336" /LENGTH=376 /DNA_ID=CAMNT_0011937285 /DNA_START=26 /DNA_END=1156 /DNA_ORIENTATION=+
MEINERILGFIAEWFDPHPQIVKKYLLKYYCETCEVEMKDLSTNRKFLKKTKIPPSLKEADFFVGANILLLSRDLKLIDYADSVTRKLLDDVDERAFCFLPPTLYDSMADIVSMIEHAGFTLVDIKSTNFVDYDDMKGAIELMRGINVDDLARPEPAIVMSFRGANSISSIHKLIESSSFVGTGLACPSDADEAKLFSSFFSTKRLTTATYEECTCCAIKPHIIKEKLVGKVLKNLISNGFVVSAIQMFKMERAAAAEFLEVYDGVVPEYREMVDEMCSGPIVAMEIRFKPTSIRINNDTSAEERQQRVVEKFRDHVGPWDVNIAKELYPRTIRGTFGRDRIRNAVHCTDLPKDGIIEVEYFFKILASSSYVDGWK